MEKKTRNTIITSIVALALVLITVTYAYFSAIITGVESASTISMTAGLMSINYAEGDENIIVSNIYPREEAWVTKTFTLTANNTTTLTMNYEVGLQITANSFKGGQLSYSLEADENNDGVSMEEATNKAIVGENRFQRIGKGSFGTITNGVQNYTLKIYFKDTGKNQNINQGAAFSAKISVRELVTPNTFVNDCTDENHSVLTQGDEYVNGQYTYRYMQSNSAGSWINIDNDGWGVTLTNKTSTDPVTTPLCTSINGKPVVSMAYMFNNSKAISIDLSSFNTSNIINMSYMFSGTDAISLDLSSFDTSNVTNMLRMFMESSATSLDLSLFDTSNVTNMAGMFWGSAASNLDLSSLDTSNVTNMYAMFRETNFSTLNLNNFDTSNVTKMNYMFYYCGATILDLSSFNTSNVENMGWMFDHSSATDLDLTSFDVSHVTDMQQMFATSAATSIVLGDFDTSSVLNMRSMFYNSRALSLDLSSFNTSSVTNMGSMFSGSAATTIELNSFDTSHVTNMDSMFSDSSATILDLSSFDTSGITSVNSWMSYMFKNAAATTGYARTQADANKFNSSITCRPSTLTFVVKP